MDDDKEGTDESTKWGLQNEYKVDGVMIEWMGGKQGKGLEVQMAGWIKMRIAREQLSWSLQLKQHWKARVKSSKMSIGLTR